MIKCRDIAGAIESLCPVRLACQWDNVGLLVGDGDKEIKKVLVTLDVDEAVVEEACTMGADMIVSHHPLMFNPINRLTEDDPQQRALRRLCSSGICVYSAHTNMDCAKDGLNDYLATKLGFEKTDMLEITSDDAGFGRVAKILGDKTLEEIIKLCEDALNLCDVRYVGELSRKISTVAINSGSGSDVLGECIKRNIDLLITGDVKYSVARTAYENGVAVIDAGHYGTEIIFTELMSQYLKDSVSGIEIFVSKANVPVLKTHCRS